MPLPARPAAVLTLPLYFTDLPMVAAVLETPSETRQGAFVTVSVWTGLKPTRMPLAAGISAWNCQALGLVIFTETA